VRTQEVKLKTIGEFVAPHLPAYEFASEVVNHFILATVQGQRRRIVAVCLDPSNFKNTGAGHTIADQMNEILAPYDLGAWKASNDRIGGWTEAANQNLNRYGEVGLQKTGGLPVFAAFRGGEKSCKHSRGLHGAAVTPCATTFVV
jgi:hypothetical protein